MSSAPSLDLSAIPEDQREAVLAVLRERDALREANKRLEHLVAELNQIVHGKKSERLSEDERQLAFEDLETAVAEVEAQQDEEAPASSGPRRAKSARRNRGNLPQGLPRTEQVIEPASLDCPCGCGTMHDLRRGFHRLVVDRAPGNAEPRAELGDRHCDALRQEALLDATDQFPSCASSRA